MPIDPKLIDVATPQRNQPGWPGYDDDLGKQVDTFEGLADVGAVDFPDEYYIEPRDYEEEAEKTRQRTTFAHNFRSHWTHQGNSHECTGHAAMQAFETAFNEARLLQVENNEVPTPVIDGQQQYFRHTINRTAGTSDRTRGGGPWLRPSGFPDGAERTAACFRAVKVINLRSVEQMKCLLIRGKGVGVGRKGHSVHYDKLVRDGSRWLAQYSDSYFRDLFDSEGTMRNAVGGAYSVVSTTIPDDWAYPAGQDLMLKPLPLNVPIWFSPMGIYSKENPGQWGGATCQGVLRQLIEYGCIPEHNGPVIAV